MARYNGSVCRLCRREGLKLFLKADRCYTEKCAVERRNYPPGQHGQGKSKYSEYGIQLREKQKVKRMYNVLERQFRLEFAGAERRRGVTGTNLLCSGLEMRLDNLVYRFGFSASRSQARQLVLHGHFTVNGRAVNIPSYHCRVGDRIDVKLKSQKLLVIVQSIESVDRRGVPGWLSLDKSLFSGVVLSVPERDAISLPIQEQLIVELYSK